MVNFRMLRELETRLLARIKSGELTENSELGPIFDAFESLDKVELTMAIEELGIEPAVKIKTVGDLLRFLRAVDSQRRC